MVSALDIPTEPTSGLQNFAIALNFVFPGVALFVVAARVAGRLTARQFGIDDWLISIAMFLSLIQTAISYIFIKTNFIGIHGNQIPPHDPTVGAIWNFATEFLYNPVLALAKSSVLFFLLRLFGHKNGVRRFIIGLNVITLLQMVAIFFAIVFQCTPITFNWDPTIKGGHCIDQRLLFVSTSAFNILTDIIVLGLPLYILADLKIRRRTKIGLIFIFLLGVIVTLTSVARMVIFVQGLFGLVVSSDPTFNIGFITSAIETNLSLITASIPALRPFLRARDRGGWLPRLGRAPDTEMARNTAYMSRASTMTTAAKKSTTGLGGGPRSVRTGGSRRGREGKLRIGTERELRSQSPRSSEEEAMTSNGIMRVSDIQREIDGLARELTAVSGTYSSFLDTDPSQPRPLPSSAAGRRRFADRYYNEGADPDLEYRTERDFNEERLSRYGERRFGVVTPKSVPPQWPGDHDNQDNKGGRDGQPF